MALQDFRSIRGHRSQISALAGVIRHGRPGHAYLFEGPEGVGKGTVASALLARLSCLQAPPEEVDPCGVCRSCAVLLRGEHPDIVRLSRDGATIKIDQVRQALSRLRFDPVLGQIKGLIVESADLLREEAANALLKTLEEPPTGTVFVLVSSKPQLLLETIRSRCQVLRFSDLSLDDLTALLVAEGKAADTARVAAALAQGSMHQARVLCDPSRMALNDEVARFALALGTTSATDAAGWIEHIAARRFALGESEETETQAGEPGDEGAPRAAKTTFSRDDLQWLLDVLRAVLRDVVLCGAGIDAATLPHARHADAVHAMATRCDPREIAATITDCQVLEQRMAINPSPRLAAAALLAQAGVRLRRR